MPIYRSINHNFFKKWTPEMAYVLGFFAADGNMIRNKRGGCYIEFEITDLDLLKKIRVLLGSNNKITAREKNKNWKVSYRLQIGSRMIFGDLLELGLTPNKSKTLQLPKVPEKYLADFVRGYFDGDGCITIGRYWRKNRNKWKWQLQSSFTSGSEQFLSELKGRMQSYANGGSVSAKKGGYNLVYSVKDSIALFRFMYGNIASGAYLERKYLKFKKALEIFKIAVVA